MNYLYFGLKSFVCYIFLVTTVTTITTITTVTTVTTVIIVTTVTTDMENEKKNLHKTIIPEKCINCDTGEFVTKQNRCI